MVKKRVSYKYPYKYLLAREQYPISNSSGMTKEQKLKLLKAKYEFYGEQAKNERIRQRVKRAEYKQSVAGRAGGFLNAFANMRANQQAYGRQFRNNNTLIPQSFRSRYGTRGRPAGPSGKYYIPGIGPVGVYEFRKYLSSVLAKRKLESQQQMQMSPLAIARARALQAQQQNPENKTIPDTRGSVPLRSIHQEIDDYANLFP